MHLQGKLGITIVTCLLTLSFVLAIGNAPHAQASPPPALPQSTATSSAGPVIVQTGVYVVNLGKLDLTDGSFTADFYLWFSWQGAFSNETGGTAPFPSEWALMNGVVIMSTLIEENQNISGTGANYVIYRVQADMSDPMSLANYPFDRHVLTIEIEDELNNESALVYQPDGETRLDSLIQLQGWNIDGPQVTASVINHFYNTTFGYPGQKVYETYSRLIVSIPIERPVFPAVAQTFIPIILILIVAMSSFLIRMDQFGTRLSLNVVSLLTAAAFQISLSANIPQFGFLTFSDRLMIGVYCLLVYSLVVTIALHSLTTPKYVNLMKRLNEYNWLIFPLASAGLVLVQFML